MENIIYLEIFYKNSWQKYAHVKIYDDLKSTFSRSSFDYEIEFVMDHIEHDNKFGHVSASVLLPLGINNFRLNNWPSMLLDLMPQGPARSQVCKRENILDNQENDFLILLKGGINPIGNIRVQSKANLFLGETFPGISYEDIIEKNDRFVDYLTEVGALVTGGSGAQGMALKFLVNTDTLGRWHCDGALKDEEVSQCFIVKFLRGRTADDRLILEAEKVYMDIAKELELYVNAPLEYHNSGILFIPRFDRVIRKNRITRLGVESMSSALGHTQFGLSSKLEDQIIVLRQYSSSFKKDILELVKRDFFNIVLGNSDNHARNTALIKTDEDTVRLSPLFDFAPMVLDPELIPRSSKWKKEVSHIPDFEYVREFLLESELGFTKKELTIFFNDFGKKLDTLPYLFSKYKLSSEVISRATKKLAPFKEAYLNFLGHKNVKSKTK